MTFLLLLLHLFFANAIANGPIPVPMPSSSPPLGAELLNTLFSPGPLIRGHKELEGTECFKCHTAGKGISDEACAACHNEIRLNRVQKIGFHGISEEDRLKNCSRGGLAAGKINKENGTGIFDPEVRKRQHKTLKEKQISAFYDPILRKEIASTGGKNGLFSKNYSERNGISDEERKKAQSERGKLGGPKNKGFRWYNDGIKDYKYSPREQEKIQFDEFIKNNQQFKPSRKPIKGYNKNNEHEDQKNN